MNSYTQKEIEYPGWPQPIEAPQRNEHFIQKALPAPTTPNKQGSLAQYLVEGAKQLSEIVFRTPSPASTPISRRSTPRITRAPVTTAQPKNPNIYDLPPELISVGLSAAGGIVDQIVAKTKFTEVPVQQVVNTTMAPNKMVGSVSAPKQFANPLKPSGVTRRNRVVNNAVVVRNAPAAKSTRISATNKAKTRQTSKGVIISHTEMIGTLVTSSSASAYACYSFVANPGKSSMFPWLSTIAVNYEKYKFRKLAVALVSNQSTSTVGKLGVGFDYDSTDDMPADRVEFFALTHHVESSIWDSVGLQIPVDNMPRFTNTHTTTDSKLIDAGQILLMADQVVATSTAVADIIVSYEVELINAQQALYSTGSCYVLTPTYVVGTEINWYSVKGPVKPKMTMTSATQLTVELPQGYYHMNLITVDTATPVVNAAALTNCVGYEIRYGDANAYLNDIYFKITSSIGTFKLDVTGAATWAAVDKFAVTTTRICPGVYDMLTTMGGLTPL